MVFLQRATFDRPREGQVYPAPFILGPQITSTQNLSTPQTLPKPWNKRAFSLVFFYSNVCRILFCRAPELLAQRPCCGQLGSGHGASREPRRQLGLFPLVYRVFLQERHALGKGPSLQTARRDVYSRGQAGAALRDPLSRRPSRPQCLQRHQARSGGGAGPCRARRRSQIHPRV